MRIARFLVHDCIPFECRPSAAILGWLVFPQHFRPRTLMREADAVGLNPGSSAAPLRRVSCHSGSKHLLNECWDHGASSAKIAREFPEFLLARVG